MDKQDLVKKGRDALAHVKKLLTSWNKTVTKDVGTVNVKFKEGTVVKKARLDLAAGLKKIAKSLELSAKKINK